MYAVLSWPYVYLKHEIQQLLTCPGLFVHWQLDGWDSGAFGGIMLIPYESEKRLSTWEQLRHEGHIVLGGDFAAVLGEIETRMSWMALFVQGRLEGALRLYSTTYRPDR